MAGPRGRLGALSGPSAAHLGPSGKGVHNFLNAQATPQPSLQNSLNHSVLSQNKLHTVAKNLRIPLRHGGPSVDQVSETPA